MHRPVKDHERNRRKLLISSLSLLLTLIFSFAAAQDSSKGGKFKIWSPSFENNGTIPQKFTCDGVNINPAIKIENIPANAKSMALVFDDIDAPGGSYVHWIVWNIDPGTKEIKEDSVPAAAIQGMNDFKKQNYGGPCPPTRAHRYVLKVYVLDVRLNLDSSSTKATLEKAMQGHVVAEAQLTGKYKRVKASAR